MAAAALNFPQPTPFTPYSTFANSPLSAHSELGLVPYGVKKHEAPAHPTLIEDLYGSPRKPRSFKQWEDAAKANTENLKKYGSPSPLVWVLVRGKNIPENALIAGEEQRKPLYIARAFYEGGICVGKAGRHLERGAAIPYKGHEVHVDTYEVLVPAFRPMRYSVTETVPISQVSRMVAPTPGIDRLNLIKTVVLVDDSLSMTGSLWRDAREALAGIADLNGQVSTEGVDLYFMNNHRSGINLKDAIGVRELFDTVSPKGETPTGKRLEDLFKIYLPRLEDRSHSHRPITLVVITDGVPTDDPTPIIIDAARRLDRSEVPLHHFGVQFAQIGEDEEATEALRELDDDLSNKYNIRDIVDTTPYNPNDRIFTSETMVKILLGPLDKRLEAVDLSVGSLVL